MEPPDEADEDIQMKKEEGNQSSKTLGITSPEKEKANQRNGTPAKPRQNPFNSGGLQDSTDYGNQTPNLNQVNGTAKTKADIISSLSKYGVKLPYPELTKGSQISQKAEDYSQQQASDDSQQQAVQTPVPKPRTLKTNNAPQDQTGSSIRTEDSFNGTSKPRGILKRRSSTSSTDSESIRLCQSAESSKIVSSGSTILEAGQDNFFDEHNTATDNSTDRLKQVRFSEKVHQRPPTPNPEPYSSIEIGEYGILDPGLSRDYLFNGFGDHHVSEEPLSEQGRYFTVDSDDAKILETNTLESQDISIRTQPASLEVERNLVEPEEEMSHINDQLRLVPSPDISIELPTNDSTGEEPMYAVVNKTPKVSSSSQDKDFDLDDALVDLQRGKTITAYQSERPLEFWKSYGGEGKIAFDSSYPEMQLKEKYSFSNEDENIATTYSNVENSPSITTQPDYNFESVASWRQPSLLRDQEQRPPSLDFTREKRTTHILQDVPIVKDPSAYVQNLPYVKYSPGEYSSETRYRSMFLQKDEDGPDGLKNNLPVAQNGQSPLKSGQTQYTFLRENKGRRDLPKSANFKVMSWSERINVVPDEQMSNPSQFQSLKHFWNVEEKNPVIGDTDISPNKLLTDFMSRNKSTKAERQQRNSREVSAEEVNLPNTFASLSEEEQTSQKVASWLAHTPAMEEVDQMHHVEDHPYPEDVTLEHVQKSTVADKTEKSATARQKPRVEIYEAPRIIEAGKLMNEDIQDVPQEKQNLMNHQQTTIAVSPVSQTSLETKPPDFKMSNQAFYDRILQMSKKQSPVKETMPPKKRPSEGDQERASVPVKSASEHIVGFQKRQEEYDFAPAEEFQEMHQPSAGKTEEVVEKSVAPESRDKQDFISALNKLETEAFNSPLEAETEAVIEKSNAPESQDKQDFISALKKLEIEAFNSPLEAETEEVIEKSNAPESQDKQDFITALNKLEIEASNLSLLNTEAEHQDNLPEEEIQQHTVSSVNSSFKIGFENFIPADNAYESEMSYEIPSKDQSVQFQSLQTYPHNKENSIEVVHDLGETVEKTTVPRQKDEELGNALRKLELEAIEDQPVEVLVHVNNNVDLLVHVNNNVDLQSPMTLQAEFLEDHSDVEDSSFRDELEQSPNASSVFQQISHPDIKEQNQPVVDEKPIQRVIVETQESNADFYSRLMRLEEEAATIPEEPEDLLEDDTIKVSQFPNREVLITKKVYSSIESLPPVDYPQENETSEETAFYSPRIKSKELNDLKSQELAINHSFPSVLYKKPEVGSPEVSNSKQGKPALTESPNGTSPSKHDKYAFEVMKAQDESRSKVLDWFNRSCDIGNDAPLTVGEESKDKTSPFQRQTGAKEESRHNKNNIGGHVILTETGSTSDQEIPAIAEKPQSRLSLSSTEFVDHDIPSVEQPAPVSLLKPVTHENPLKYGNSGVGYGKISNQAASSAQKDAQVQEANYLDVSEEDKKGFSIKEGIKDPGKDTLIQTVTKLPSSPEIPESFERPHSQFSLLSAENTSDEQSNIQKDEEDFTENVSPLILCNTKLEAKSGLEFSLSEDESGEISNSKFSDVIKKPQPVLSQSSTERMDHGLVDVLEPSTVHIMKEELIPSKEIHSYLVTTELPSSRPIPEKSETPHLQVSSGSKEDGNDQSDIQRYESKGTDYSTSPPEQVNSYLEAGNILEFGNSGGGSGKTLSQTISEVLEKPNLRSVLSSTESMNLDHTDVLNIAHPPADIVKYDLLPPEQLPSNLKAIELSTSQEIPQKSEMAHLHVSVGKTENTIDDHSDINKDESLTPSKIIENTAPRELNNSNLEDGNILEFGKNESGSGNKLNLEISEVFGKAQIGSPLNRPVSIDYADVAPSPVAILNDTLVPADQIHSPSLEIPGNSEKPHSQLSLGSTEQTNNNNSNIENYSIMTSSDFIENDASPPEQIYSNLGARNNLEPGKIDGSGKMSEDQEISKVFKDPPSRSPLRSIESMAHDQAEVLSVEPLPPAETGKGELVPPEQIHPTLVAMESLSSCEIPEKTHSKLSLGSVENTNGDHSYKQEDESINPSNITENSSSPEHILHLEAGQFLQFNSGGGSGNKLNREISEVFGKAQTGSPLNRPVSIDYADVAPSPVSIMEDKLVPADQMHSDLVVTVLPPSPENSEKPHAQLSLDSTEHTNDNDSNIEKDSILTSSNFIENDASPPEQINSNLEAINNLESGKSYGSPNQAKPPPRSPLSIESMAHDQVEVLSVEPPPAEMRKEELVPSEKIHPTLVAMESLSSRDIPEKSHSRFSLGSAENTNGDRSYKQEDESFNPSNITENSSSPEHILELEAGQSLQFGNSGGGSGKLLNQDDYKVFERPPLRSPLFTTQRINYNNAEAPNVVLSSVQMSKDESVSAEQMHLDLEPVNPLTFESGFGKMSNQSANDTKSNIQPREVENMHVFDKENEYFQVEKQKVGILKEPSEAPVEVQAGFPDRYTAEKENVETVEPQNLNQKLVNSNIAQKKVGDMKLLWESERSSQPTVKTVPNRSQRTFSSSDVSGHSRNSSIDSDDQTASSLVTFKKVMVDEDEERLSPPIDHLKSFWENEANKETVNTKPLDKSSAAVADLTYKVKRLTLNPFFEKEHVTGAERNLQGRSVSVSGNVSENIKDLPKSATFQSLRSFWNVDIKSKRNYMNPHDRAFLESKKRQFRSNPDLSKESFVARIKSKLDSKSLLDIREDAPPTSHFQSGEAKHDTKNRAPRLRKISKENSGDSSSGSTEAQEPFVILKNNISLKSVPPETKQRPPPEGSENVSDLMIKSSALKTATFNERSLTLPNLKNEYENSSRDTERGYNGEKMHYNEYQYGPKPVLVKQTGFDARSSVDANESVSYRNGNGEDVAECTGLAQIKASQEVHETFEKTIITNKNESRNFDQELQKLYNESLEVSLVTHAKLNQNEYMDIQKPEENFSKVLTLSSGKIERSVQRSSSKDNNTASYQPIVIDVSSKKNAGNDKPTSKVDDSYVTVQLPDALEDKPESNVNNCDKCKTNEDTNIHREEPTKEILEGIEMPTILPKAQFNNFDEGLKKLYDESRDLTSALTSISDSHAFQFTPAERESLNYENKVSSSQESVGILRPEVTETIEKTNAPSKMSFAQSLEKLQKEAMNDEPGPFMEHIPSSHVTLVESQPKFSEPITVEGSVSEMPTRVAEASVQEKMDVPQYEDSNMPFTDMRQSTPVKENNGSLRRSTLELYLAAPYRREISKSMDFEFGGYIASDAIEETCRSYICKCNS